MDKGIGRKDEYVMGLRLVHFALVFALAALDSLEGPAVGADEMVVESFGALGMLTCLPK